jgi:hypothetical protein
VLRLATLVLVLAALKLVCLPWQLLLLGECWWCVAVVFLHQLRWPMCVLMCVHSSVHTAKIMILNLVQLYKFFIY